MDLNIVLYGGIMKKRLISHVLAISLFLGGFTPSVLAIADFDQKAVKNKPSLVRRVSKEILEDSKIMIGAILAAIAYGIGNDQVTARVCPEYFTEGFHKNMLQRNVLYGNKLAAHMMKVTNPTKIGLYWGVMATWWFGALLGAPTVLAARLGKWPKIAMKDLIKPLGVGLAFLYAMSAAAGGYGYLASKNGWLSSGMRQNIRLAAGNTPSSAMHRYTADAFAHHVGYFGGALVAVGLIGWTLRERYKRAQDEKRDQTTKCESNVKV